MIRIQIKLLLSSIKPISGMVLSLSFLLSGLIALAEARDNSSGLMTQVQAQQSPGGVGGRRGGGGARNRGQVPGRFRGGGSRKQGLCPASLIPLTALVPYTKDPAFDPPAIYVGGVTTSERPTFWFYVPYTLTTDLTADFVLRDGKGTEIYRTQITNFPASGQVDRILSIEIPKTVQPLAPGQVYRWYLQINCKAEIPMYVDGGIERILPTDASGPQATPLSYDQITALGKRWRSNPQDPATAKEWANLLQLFGITDTPSPSTTRENSKSNI
jgi:hypothetical protein